MDSRRDTAIRIAASLPVGHPARVKALVRLSSNREFRVRDERGRSYLWGSKDIREQFDPSHTVYKELMKLRKGQEFSAEDGWVFKRVS
jgi:hypothetical protein